MLEQLCAGLPAEVRPVKQQSALSQYGFYHNMVIEVGEYVSQHGRS